VARVLRDRIDIPLIAGGLHPTFSPEVAVGRSGNTRHPVPTVKSGITPGPGLPDLEAKSRENEAASLPARASEVLAHHPLVWHMSPANRSDRQRHAWSITFLAPGVRWAPEHAPHPLTHEMKPGTGSLLSGRQFPLFS